MTLLNVCLGFAIFLTFSFSSFAKNDRIKLSVNDAIQKGYNLNKISKDIELHFGTAKKIKGVKELGTYTSNKKTNAFGKSAKEACEWAFLSAMISFQDRARSQGGNAVINIRSNYYDKILDSEEMFECGSGNVVAGVTFVGDVVTIKK